MKPRLIGAKLKALAERKQFSAPQIASMAGLRTDQIERVFESLGQIGTMFAVADALGVSVAVKGWRLPLKKRALDVASEARVAEPTARSAIAALNSWSTVPHSTLVESLESVLFTVPGAEFVLTTSGSEVR